MARKKAFTARHFRGLTTVEDVRQRCRIDDFTGCWHWTGAMNSDAQDRKTPMLWVFDTARGKFRNMTGPIAILELQGKRTPEITTGWRTCLCNDCLNPAHIAGGTKKQWGEWIRAQGLFRNRPARIAAAQRAARARATSTPPEIVKKVRESPLNGVQAAAAFGVSPQQVSKFRTGKAWANKPAMGSSVFTLGAR